LAALLTHSSVLVPVESGLQADACIDLVTIRPDHLRDDVAIPAWQLLQPGLLVFIIVGLCHLRRLLQPRASAQVQQLQLDLAVESDHLRRKLREQHAELEIQDLQSVVGSDAGSIIEVASGYWQVGQRRELRAEG